MADHDCTTTALGVLGNVDVVQVVERCTSVIAMSLRLLGQCSRDQ
jgi:hypothetical protein